MRSILPCVIAVLFVSLFASPVRAQSSSLFGTVRDFQTGEDIIGANVFLVGTSFGATTDVEGKYTVRNLPAGTYSIRVSYVGYGTKVVTGIDVKAGESKKMDVDLAPATVEAEEVVVTAERQLATESAMLALRKQSSRIGDGFSVEQVKKSADATSADALGRVTGVSVVDNKFIFVRGVTDRYNSTQLNGVNVTSTDTDADKKSFAFDMIPANLLENTIVAKTATPDLPGDFTGGLVQLTTVDFPDRSVFKIAIGGSYNNITTFSDVQASLGGGRDWAGIDDGARDFPDGFPQGTVENLSGNTKKYELGQTLSNTWAQRSARAPLSGRFEASYGDRFPVGGGELGTVAALNYSSGYSRTEVDYQWKRLVGRGTIDRYNALWGGIFSLSYKFGGFNKISFRNSYNQSGQDGVTLSYTVDDNNSQRQIQVTEWDERSLYVTSLTGEHTLPWLGGAQVVWRGSYTQTLANEPDRKTLLYRIEDPPTKDHTDRSWANLDEFSRGLGLDITYPFGDWKLKLGGLVEGRERYYDIRTFLPELDRLSFRYDLYQLPPDSIFMQENFGPGLLVMDEISSELDIYTGNQDVQAAYLMADVPFTLFGDHRFRAVAGARVEHSDQRVNTISPFLTGEPYVARVDNTDILPSVNLTYEVTPTTNLRLAYGISVNRPEFRELSSFYFYDYSIYEGMFGNPLLRRALSRNYDLRLETFPGIGEVMSASLFYKRLTDPIEMKILESSNPERTWFNSPKGTNYGWELEVRKALDFLGSAFSSFMVVGNYTRIYSDIEYTVYIPTSTPGVSVPETRTRPMQGQAPYTLNVSMYWTQPVWGTSVSVLYNQFGRRLDAIGNIEDEDVFEESRRRIDLAVNQMIGSAIEIKFTIRDLFPERRVLVTRVGEPYRTYFTGSTASLKIGLTL